VCLYVCVCHSVCLPITRITRKWVDGFWSYLVVVCRSDPVELVECWDYSFLIANIAKVKLTTSVLYSEMVQILQTWCNTAVLFAGRSLVSDRWHDCERVNISHHVSRSRQHTGTAMQLVGEEYIKVWFLITDSPHSSLWFVLPFYILTQNMFTAEIMAATTTRTVSN